MSGSAVVTERRDRFARPVFLRAVAASPLSPLASGAVLFVVLVVLQLLAWLAMGRLLALETPTTSVELRTMLFFAVVLSLAPPASRGQRRGPAAISTHWVGR